MLYNSFACVAVDACTARAEMLVADRPTHDARDCATLSDHVTSRNLVNQWYVLVGVTVCLFNLSSVHSKCDPLTNIRKNAPDYLNYIDPQFRQFFPFIWVPTNRITCHNLTLRVEIRIASLPL